MNDRAVMERLVSSNMMLAYSIANKYRGSSMNMADLESAAMFGLAKAAVSYDPSRGIRFSSFAAPCIKNEIRMELRKARKHMGQIPVDAERYVAEDAYHTVTLLDLLSYEDAAFEQVEGWDSIRSILSVLNKQEQQAIVLVVCNELPQTKAGEKMGLSQGTVSKLIKSGLAKIRKKYM